MDDSVSCIPLAVRDGDEDFLDIGNGVTYSPPLMPRDYTDINITGNPENDDAQMKLARHLIRNSRANMIKDNAVRFCFGAKSKYNEYVKALTICHEEEATLWIVEKNFIYVTHFESQYEGHPDVGRIKYSQTGQF